MQKIKSNSSRYLQSARIFCKKILDHFIHKEHLPNWDLFYDEFEHKFRGSCELIYQRMTDRYNDILAEQLKNFECKDKTQNLLDLGCGHGEFLKLAKTKGFVTYGVDASKKAIDNLREMNHHLICGDLLKSLSSFPKGKFSVITLFHVIEHCEPEYILNVFHEVKKCLQPGGIFIVETPSIHSLWVSSKQFFLDPTHVKLVHPDYMRFLGEYMGFSDIQKLEFDEVKHHEKIDFSLFDENLNHNQKIELDKLKNWLYGPMDVSLIYKKI